MPDHVPLGDAVTSAPWLQRVLRAGQAEQPGQTRRRANMSLMGDAIVYVLILIAVLAVIAGIMYAVARLWGPVPEETQARASDAYQSTVGRGAE
jgi:hypothetical protein